MTSERPIRNELVRMPEAEYHADPAPPSLSSSIARVLVKQSPLHAYTRHPRLGGIGVKATPEMDRGTLMHKLLLEDGRDIAIVEHMSFKSESARSERDAALAEGKFPVLAHEFNTASFAARKISERIANLGISLTGESEVTALWGEPASDGTLVQCRARIDHLASPRVYDLKSCHSAHPDACQKHVEAYGYDIQRAAYVRAIESLKPEWAGRVDFILVFFETEPPFEVVPRRLSGEFRMLGEQKWRRAVDTWSRCIASGLWPGYVSDNVIADLEPSRWAVAKEQEDHLSAARSTWSTDCPF